MQTQPARSLSSALRAGCVRTASVRTPRPLDGSAQPKGRYVDEAVAAGRRTMPEEALDVVWTSLLARRCQGDAIPRIAGHGVYALFLRSMEAIPGLEAGPDGLLYIGMTDASLKERNHFAHADSGFSSPRPRWARCSSSSWGSSDPARIGSLADKHPELSLHAGGRNAPDRLDDGPPRLRLHRPRPGDQGQRGSADRPVAAAAQSHRLGQPPAPAAAGPT